MLEYSSVGCGDLGVGAGGGCGGCWGISGWVLEVGAPVWVGQTGASGARGPWHRHSFHGGESWGPRCPLGAMLPRAPSSTTPSIAGERWGATVPGTTTPSWQGGWGARAGGRGPGPGAAGDHPCIQVVCVTIA